MTGIDTHVTTAHMVLGRDLNPHDTLFAGTAASNMLECGFLAVQHFLQTPHIVFLSLDGFRFLRPVKKGDTYTITSTIIRAGTTSVSAYLELRRGSDQEKAAECFVTFVHIDEATGRAIPHGVTLPGLSAEGRTLLQQYLAYVRTGR